MICRASREGDMPAGLRRVGGATRLVACLEERVALKLAADAPL